MQRGGLGSWPVLDREEAPLTRARPGRSLPPPSAMVPGEELPGRRQQGTGPSLTQGGQGSPFWTVPALQAGGGIRSPWRALDAAIPCMEGFIGRCLASHPDWPRGETRSPGSDDLSSEVWLGSNGRNDGNSSRPSRAARRRGSARPRRRGDGTSAAQRPSPSPARLSAGEASPLGDVRRGRATSGGWRGSER